MAGERRVRVDAARLLEDLDTGEILDPFENRGGGRLVDVLGDRHRQERAVHLAVEAGFHVLDRYVDPAREPSEDLRPVAVSTDDVPVDGDGEHPFVVGENAAFGVEDPTALGQQRDRAPLGLLDFFLEPGLLDGLQEPQARADEAEQHRSDECEHAEARGAFVESHPDSLPVTQPSCWSSRPRSWELFVTRRTVCALGASERGIRSVACSAGAVQAGPRIFRHQRLSGNRTGDISAPVSATIRITLGMFAGQGFSSPMKIRTTGSIASPAAQPSPTKIAFSHHCGSAVISANRPATDARRP